MTDIGVVVGEMVAELFVVKVPGSIGPLYGHIHAGCSMCGEQVVVSVERGRWTTARMSARLERMACPTCGRYELWLAESEY